MITAQAQALTRPRGSTEHMFFGAMALAMLASVCLGFARSFLLRPWFPEVKVPPEPFFLLHGAVFLTWFILLVVQTTLVARGRLVVHRSLGVLGAVLATVMILAGLTGAIIAARRPGGFIGIPIPPLQFLVIPFVDMVLFGSLIGTGLSLRRRPQAHKRSCSSDRSPSPAAIARWPFVLGGGPPAFFGITDLFLVPLVVWDFSTRRRLHPATLGRAGIDRLPAAAPSSSPAPMAG